MGLNNDIMRLIELAKEENEPNRIDNSNEYKELFNKVDDKSMKIDEIEKELEIDLITLFKAIKQGYIYKKLGDGSIDKVNIDMLNFEEGFKCAIFSKTYAEGNYKQCYKMDTYINSKNWALTKEELI